MAEQNTTEQKHHIFLFWTTLQPNLTLRWVVLGVVMTGWLVIVLIPFLWTLASSFKEDPVIFADVSPFKLTALIPLEPTLTAYSKVLFKDGFIGYIKNSTIVAGSVLILGLTVNALAAYAFSRFRFPGKNLLFVLVLITFMVPFETIVIPLYVVVNQFGWVDTYMGLIAPSVADAVAIFLLRQFFLEIPKELEEAATIDGANPLRIFVSVIIPLSVPGLITAGLSVFVFQWNAFFWPLTVTKSAAVRVVQVGISLYFTENQIYYNKIFAAAVLSALPTILLYTFLQRYFIRSVSISGIK